MIDNNSKAVLAGGYVQEDALTYVHFIASKDHSIIGQLMYPPENSPGQHNLFIITESPCGKVKNIII